MFFLFLLFLSFRDPAKYCIRADISSICKGYEIYRSERLNGKCNPEEEAVGEKIEWGEEEREALGESEERKRKEGELIEERVETIKLNEKYTIRLGKWSSREKD